MSKKELPKIVVILGPTASGKSDLAVILAKKFNGEIISADSRQVYKGLNIGSGKVTKKEMGDIPHFLLGISSPKKVFTVFQFKEMAEKTIGDILMRGKLPIVAGGTGFYIQSIVDNITIPQVPPNKKLREQLNKKTNRQLFAILKKLDPERASNIDIKNSRRLVRAIEIARSLGKVPKLKKDPQYKSLQIGIKTKDSELTEGIEKRLTKRLRTGMIAEVKNLHKNGLSWKRMEELGLEYRYLARFLQNKISKKEMVEQLNKEIKKYAKRQKTWLKRDTRVKWLYFKEIEKAEKLVGKFL